MVWVFFLIFFSVFAQDKQKKIEAIVPTARSSYEIMKLDDCLIRSSNVLTNVHDDLGNTDTMLNKDLPKIPYFKSFLRLLNNLCGGFYTQDESLQKQSRQIALSTTSRLLGVEDKLELVNLANFLDIKYLSEFVYAFVVKNDFDQASKIIFNSDLNEHIFNFIPLWVCWPKLTCVKNTYVPFKVDNNCKVVKKLNNCIELFDIRTPHKKEIISLNDDEECLDFFIKERSFLAIIKKKDFLGYKYLIKDLNTGKIVEDIRFNDQFGCKGYFFNDGKCFILMNSDEIFVKFVCIEKLITLDHSFNLKKIRFGKHSLILIDKLDRLMVVNSTGTVTRTIGGVNNAIFFDNEELVIASYYLMDESRFFTLILDSASLNKIDLIPDCYGKIIPLEFNKVAICDKAKNKIIIPSIVNKKFLNHEIINSNFIKVEASKNGEMLFILEKVDFNTNRLIVYNLYKNIKDINDCIVFEKIGKINDFELSKDSKFIALIKNSGLERNYEFYNIISKSDMLIKFVLNEIKQDEEDILNSISSS